MTDASQAIARLRELRDEYWKAAGPFKMLPYKPPERLSLFDLSGRYIAESAIALPALLECAEALEKVARQAQVFDDVGGVAFDDQFEPFDLTTNGHRIVGLTVGDLRKARLALQALAEGGGE